MDTRSDKMIQQEILRFELYPPKTKGGAKLIEDWIIFRFVSPCL